MLKEYRSRWGMYTTDIKVGDTRIHIVFTGLGDGGSYYVTTDEKVAVALEKKTDFGSDYYLFRVETEKEKEVDNDQESDSEVIPSDKPKINLVEDVVNITQAREYLKKEGVDHRKLMSPAAIMKQAESLGVEFPNLAV